MNPRSTLRAGTQRAGWTIADQALSSVTNMAASVIVARSVPAADFGAYAIAFAVYLVAVGASRAVATDVLGVRASAVSEDEWREMVARALGTVAAIGCATSALLVVAAAICEDELRWNLLALASLATGLLLQDAWRFAFFAQGRPVRAFLNDCVWAFALILLLGVCVANGVDRSWPFVAAWAASGSIAGGFGIVQSGVVPAIGSTRRWLADHRDLWPSFLGEYAVQSGAGQVVTFGVGALVTLAAVGSLRGAQVVFGPVAVILMSTVAIAVPEGVRLVQRSGRHLLTGMAALSAVGATAALSWGVATAHLLPDQVGRALLGPTWDGAEPLLVPLGLLMACSATSLGASAGLRAIQQARTGLRTRLVVAPLTAGGGLAGAATGGVVGAVWGQIVPMALGAVLWWTRLVRAIGHHPSPSDTGAAEAVPDPYLTSEP